MRFQNVINLCSYCSSNLSYIIDLLQVKDSKLFFNSCNKLQLNQYIKHLAVQNFCIILFSKTEIFNIWMRLIHGQSHSTSNYGTCIYCSLCISQFHQIQIHATLDMLAYTMEKDRQGSINCICSLYYRLLAEKHKAFYHIQKLFLFVFFLKPTLLSLRF